MQKNLVFDLGMNDGRDTSFYLAKGFNVVGVEASSDLCARVKRELAADVADGRLVIENVAIAERRGPIEFFPNDKDVWGTTRPDWATRNATLAHTAKAPVTVAGETIAGLVERHGVPYYMKVDIEGADMTALEGLLDLLDRPNFVSVESDKVSWEALLHEFDVLRRLGYKRFKVVAQQWVRFQRLPSPAREGRYSPWRFKLGDSGAFGDEAPGDWLTAEDAIRRYERIFSKYRLFGDAGRLTPPSLPGVAVRRYVAGWYDTHAGR